MPFTFAHPAVVIPCKKKFPKYLNLSALVIGSMAPDFEYFLRFMPKGTIGHTLLGSIWFDIPLVIILYLLWEYIIKRPFILSMPQPIDKNLYHITHRKSKNSTIKKRIIFIYSALIGIYSHILWDSFTHKTGFFVMKLSLLSNKIGILNYKVPIYKFLQHGSTIIGIIYIIVYLYSLMKYTDCNMKFFNKEDKINYWILVIVITFSIFLYRITMTLDFVSLKYFGIYIVSFISSILLSILIVSFVFKIKYRN
ncbi:membrane protein [Clostridium botulinum C/D str. BKT12695]|nr:membrane protein [Clostridium botulinum C/D str. BKT12695]